MSWKCFSATIYLVGSNYLRAVPVSCPVSACGMKCSWHSTVLDCVYTVYCSALKRWRRDCVISSWHIETSVPGNAVFIRNSRFRAWSIIQQGELCHDRHRSFLINDKNMRWPGACNCKASSRLTSITLTKLRVFASVAVANEARHTHTHTRYLLLSRGFFHYGTRHALDLVTSIFQHKLEAGHSIECIQRSFRGERVRTPFPLLKSWWGGHQRRSHCYKLKILENAMVWHLDNFHRTFAYLR